MPPQATAVLAETLAAIESAEYHMIANRHFQLIVSLVALIFLIQVDLVGQTKRDSLSLGDSTAVTRISQPQDPARAESDAKSQSPDGRWIIWLTLGLLISNLLYTAFSFRMLSIMKATHELEHRAYVAFDNIHLTASFHPTKPISDIQVGVVLRNAGRILARFRMEQFVVRIGDREIINPLFENMSDSLFPGSQTTFKYPSFNDVDLSHMPITGVIEYTMTYGPTFKALTHQSKMRIRFEIPMTYPLQFTYLIIEHDEV